MLLETTAQPGEILNGSNRDWKIISNQTKSVFILTFVKSFSCRSSRQSYFSTPIYTIRLWCMGQAYDVRMTWCRTIYMCTTKSTYNKYAKVCTRIYGAKVLTNRKQIFLSCALKKLSSEMFFALICLVLFEKQLHVSQSITTSSAILTEENLSFISYSVAAICHKIRHF